MAKVSVSLTVLDAAGRLNCSVQTVRNLIRRGALPAYRVGRDFRISEKDLQVLRVQVPDGEGGGL